MQYLFRPGERVRLRLINGSAMTFFNVRIPGLAMTVVAADGQQVAPVEVDELQIGVAETYDVMVTPGSAAAYTIVGEAMDRSGWAIATLASAPGLRAPLPERRPPPLLTMADMGMDHGPGQHSMRDMKMRDTSLLPPDVKLGPGIDMVAMNPVDRMGDPGIGLDNVGHRVLTYKQLSAASQRPVRTPTRLLELHLTGNMERYMWSFDGRAYSAVTDTPIRFAHDERVRVKLINNTMMAHPIHLHGHFFELVNGADAASQPLKHTLIVQPGGSAQFDLTANEPGDWAFHCHLLYHMHAGMMQVVTVAAPPAA
jgi:FtsP/CotA-like multicopper oxidase with cupredoxin domain